MTDSLAYCIRVGALTVSNKATGNERLLLSLDVRLGMDGFGGVCELLLGDPENAPPQIGDALSVE